jgi:hypothetical protein
MENEKPSSFPIVAERADNAAIVFEQGEDSAFHVHVDALVNTVILQRPDHFQTGPVSDVGQARIFMSAEISLKNATVLSAIENSAPRLKLPHPRWSFSRVQLRHSPIINVLPSAHGIGEMDLPIVAIVDIGQGCGNSTFSHDGVRFAKKGFANQADGNSRC